MKQKVYNFSLAKSVEVMYYVHIEGKDKEKQK